MEGKNNKKYKYLAQNTLLLTISQFGSKFLAFFLVPLYTSVLSTQDYGIADVISTSVTLLIYVCTFYIGSAVLRFSLENKGIAKYTFYFAMKILTIGTLVIIIALILLNNLKILEVDFYILFFVVGLFVADSLESIVYEYLRGIEKVFIMSIASFLSSSVRLILSILTLVFFRWGLFGYLLSMTVGPIVASSFALIWDRKDKIKKVNLSRAKKKQLHKEMLHFSIPTAISQLGWWVNNSIDRYMVVAFIGAAKNGIYAVSYKIPSIMAMISNIFAQAWGISAIKEFDPEDKDGFFGNMSKLYTSALCIVCSAIILFNILCSRILFQKDFFEAWKYASLLVLSMVFSGLSCFFSGVFYAVKKNKYSAMATIVSALSNIILNAIFIPRIGVLGAAIATAISFYLCYIIQFVNAKRFIKFDSCIVRHHIVYVLIIVQIIFEHMPKHFYIGQVAIFIAIIVIYRKFLKTFISKGKEIIRHLVNKGNE